MPTPRENQPENLPPRPWRPLHRDLVRLLRQPMRTAIRACAPEREWQAGNGRHNPHCARADDRGLKGVRILHLTRSLELGWNYVYSRERDSDPSYQFHMDRVMPRCLHPVRKDGRARKPAPIALIYSDSGSVRGGLVSLTDQSSPALGATGADKVNPAVDRPNRRHP